MKPWKPVVVGVDGSEASVLAAAAGAMIARRAGVRCVLVYAMPGYEHLVMESGYVVDLSGAVQDAKLRDRAAIVTALGDQVPQDVADSLEIEVGSPATVLCRVAERLHAGLIVIGARPHTGLERLAARLARNLVRTADVPLLVTSSGSPVIQRVLAAIDLSSASQRTWEAAVRWARLFGAHLRALHVQEPLVPMIGPLGPVITATPGPVADVACSDLWERIPAREFEKVIRVGSPRDAIAGEASDWRADLVVIGSHGHSWADLLTGRTAEALACEPPAMTLVVPSGHPAENEVLAIGALPWEERELQAAG